MTKKDPTEDVLATIARIFEQADVMKTRHPLAPKSTAKSTPGPALERAPIVNPFAREDTAQETARPVPAETQPPDEAAAVSESAETKSEPEPAPPSQAPPEPGEPKPQPLADSYVRLGPGPLPAIRFRWAARPDGQGGYFVDETIGQNSRAITNGPMSGEDAIAFIDLQAQEAFERFERLKQSAAELPTHREPQATVEQVHAEHDASEDHGL